MNTSFLRAAVAGLALVAISGTGFAADLARRAPVATPYETPVSVYNWTGFYAGANIGGEFLRDDATVSGFSGKLNKGAVMGGLQAGYNFQTGPWVVGLEADIGYGHPKKSGVFGAPFSMTTEQGLSGTARARAGYAIDRTLVYGTGGLAWSNFETTTNNGAGFIQKHDSTRLGYAVGAGLEHAVTNNISVKGEYLYEGFGRQRVNFANVGATRQDLSDHIVRVGLNYKF